MSRVFELPDTGDADVAAIRQMCPDIREHDAVFVAGLETDRCYLLFNGALELVSDSDGDVFIWLHVTGRHRNALEYFAAVRTRALAHGNVCFINVLPSDSSLAAFFDPVDTRPHSYMYGHVAIDVRLLSTCFSMQCPCGDCSKSTSEYDMVAGAKKAAANGRRLREHLDSIFTVHDTVLLVTQTLEVLVPPFMHGAGFELVAHWRAGANWTARTATASMRVQRGQRVFCVRMQHRRRQEFLDKMADLSAYVVGWLFAGVDRTFAADPDDGYVAVDNRLRFLRPPAIHDKMLDIALALAPTSIPPYVLLWITDWLPRAYLVGERTKIAWIERVYTSMRAVWARREQRSVRPTIAQ